MQTAAEGYGGGHIPGSDMQAPDHAAAVRSGQIAEPVHIGNAGSAEPSLSPSPDQLLEPGMQQSPTYPPSSDELEDVKQRPQDLPQHVRVRQAESGHGASKMLYFGLAAVIVAFLLIGLSYWTG